MCGSIKGWILKLFYGALLDNELEKWATWAWENYWESGYEWLFIVFLTLKLYSAYWGTFDTFPLVKILYSYSHKKWLKWKLLFQ